MPKPSTILITGSAGKIGRSVVAELGKRQEPVRGLDRIPTPGLEADSMVGNLTSRDDLARALEGVGTVIHLAATPDDGDFTEGLLPNNLLGVYHLFEAAHAVGVQRLVLASSGQLNWWQQHRGPWPVRVEDAITPRYWYAATKGFLEAAGRAWAEQHQVAVVSVRIGWCPRNPGHIASIEADPISQDIYLSPGDAGRFFALAARAPLPSRFQIFFATSRPRHRERFDLQPAREILGYEPQEAWPEGL